VEGAYGFEVKLRQLYAETDANNENIRKERQA
jgi:hypothetical protein